MQSYEIIAFISLFIGVALSIGKYQHEKDVKLKNKHNQKERMT